MTDPADNSNDRTTSGRPEWLRNGYTWDLAQVVFGFMAGLALGF